MTAERKTRKTITSETLRSARNFIERNFETKEIARVLELSYNATLNLCNKIVSGKADSEILRKKGRKLISNSTVIGLF